MVGEQEGESSTVLVVVQQQQQQQQQQLHTTITITPSHVGDGSYGTRGCRDDENELQETNQIQRVPVERRTQQLLRAKQCVQDFDNIKIHNNHDGTGYTSRRAHIRCTGGPLHLDSEQGAELRHRGNMETDMWIHSLGSTGALGRKFFCEML